MNETPLYHETGSNEYNHGPNGRLFRLMLRPSRATPSANQMVPYLPPVGMEASVIPHATIACRSSRAATLTGTNSITVGSLRSEVMIDVEGFIALRFHQRQ